MAKTKKIKCAVVGGLGFLGSNLVDELNQLNYDVKIIDNKNIKQKGYFKCDIKDYKSLKKILLGCDYVFNFAGIADISEANKDPIKTINENIIGSSNIFDICSKNKVKRVFLASTLYVYSNSGGFYKTTKQALENILETYSKNFKLKFTVLRYGSIYGADSQNWNGIYKYVEQAVQKNKILCNGDGEEIREYIHVKDAAKITVKAMNKKYENQFITISGINSLKAKDLFTMISEILNKKIIVKYNKNLRTDEHYKTTPYNYIPKRSLKIVPSEFIDLGEGLIEIIEKNFRKNN